MKQHNEHIEAEVRKTMQLLDQMEPIAVHHLFRARLMERIGREFGGEAAPSAGGFLRHLDLRLAFMTVLVIVNLGSAALSLQEGGNYAASAVRDTLETASDDYSSQEFAYYEQTTANMQEGLSVESKAP
ncbi:MAG: hypothetical protein WCH05_06830 [Chlorobiaceae bacterium]